MKTPQKAFFALWIAAGGMISAVEAIRPEKAVCGPCAGCAAQVETPRIDTLRCRRGPFTEHDTLFLYRYDAIVDGRFRDYCDVFVERGCDSLHRRRLLAAASLDEEENRRTLDELLQALRRRYPGPLRRHDCDIAQTWLSAVRTEGACYISEWEQYPVHITDSLLIEQMQDGPWPSLLDSFERVEEGHYRFATRRIYPDGEGAYDLYVVDPVREIALLAEHSAAETRYRLLVAARKAELFDLLVWRSAEMPAGNEIRTAGAEEFRRWIETRYPKKTRRE